MKINKNIFAILIIALLISVSCNKEYDDVNYLIKNESTVMVTYDFFNNINELLDVDSEPKNYIINSSEGILKPVNIVSDPVVILTVISNGRSGYEYIFQDDPSTP